MKKHNKHKHTVRHLGMPHHRSHLQHFQKNAMVQHQYLAAQDAMQNRINHIQRISYTGDPYIR